MIDLNIQRLPEEVSLTKDRNDYENLTQIEKFIFNSNLRWQTMTDSMLSRSIHNIKNYVSNPELEICMTTWARFETPQFAYMIIAMVCFGKYTNSVRMNYVKRAYDYL